MPSSAESDSETVHDENPRRIMGYERPLNAISVALLIVATWIFWSLRAAAIIFGLFVIATIVGIWILRNNK